jgi:hypothetical protein
MRLYYTDCSTLLAQGTSSTDDEQIVYTVADDGTYSVMIYGSQGAENGYDMVVEVVPAGATATPTRTPTGTATPTRTVTPTSTGTAPRPRLYLPLLMRP